MKDYPHKVIFVEEGQLGPAFSYKQPTEEAIKNFISYLDPHELERYNNMSERGKLRVALSVNPFIFLANYSED